MSLAGTPVIVVTYAQKDPQSNDEVAGAGFGLVNVFDASGTLVGDIVGLDALTRQQIQREEAMAALDDAVGYLFDQLRKQQVFDNTLIMLVSDNGVEMGEHNLGQKEYAY